MNFDRIYQYRFKDVKKTSKIGAWTLFSDFIWKKMGCPERVLDPAAGECEFINLVQAKEKWAIDYNEAFLKKNAEPNIKQLYGNCLEIAIEENYYDGIFVSNFLEHLYSQEQVSEFLKKMNKCLKKGGKIAIMGPNFKYCYKEYFDFADHSLILTHLSLAEHLYAEHFSVEYLKPQFLPISFRGNLPAIPFLIKMYLRLPFFWRFFGKQFLIVAKKD